MSITAPISTDGSAALPLRRITSLRRDDVDSDTGKRSGQRDRSGYGHYGIVKGELYRCFGRYYDFVAVQGVHSRFGSVSHFDARVRWEERLAPRVGPARSTSKFAGRRASSPPRRPGEGVPPRRRPKTRRHRVAGHESGESAEPVRGCRKQYRVLVAAFPRHCGPQVNLDRNRQAFALKTWSGSIFLDHVSVRCVRKPGADGFGGVFDAESGIWSFDIRLGAWARR